MQGSHTTVAHALTSTCPATPSGLPLHLTPHRRVPPGAGPDAECLTGERPLYVTQAFHTEVANCRCGGRGGLRVRVSVCL